MDIRIEGLHEQAIRKLAKVNDLPTVASMVRILIRDAAQEAGIWPQSSDETVSQDQPQPVTNQ